MVVVIHVQGVVYKVIKEGRVRQLNTVNTTTSTITTIALGSAAKQLLEDKEVREKREWMNDCGSIQNKWLW